MNRTEYVARALLVLCTCGLSAGAHARERPSWEDHAESQPLDAVQNPARGFMTSFERALPRKGYHPKWRPAGTTVEDSREGTRFEQGALVRYKLDLGGFCDGAPLDLTGLEADLAAARDAGATFVFRAAYAWPKSQPVPRQDPCRNTRDDARRKKWGDPLSNDVAVEHARQLAASLSKFPEVVAVVEAGMLGWWGEWHHFAEGELNGDASSTGADGRVPDADAAALLKVWRTAFPTTPIAVRSPDRLLATGEPLSFHNDCFLASPSDNGTWGADDTDSSVYNQKRNDVALRLSISATPDGPARVFGGETCEPEADANRFAPEAAREEMVQFHPTYLTIDYFPGAHQEWAKSDFRVEVARRLGYRLYADREGTQAHLSSDGRSLDLRVTLKNDGFAAPIRAWKLNVSVGANEIPWTPAGAEDTRLWLPGSTIVLTDTVALTQPLQGGEQLYLRIDDPSGNPRYRVCLAPGPWTTGGEGTCTNTRANPIAVVTVGE